MWDIRRSQVQRLHAAAIKTVRELGGSGSGRIQGIGEPALDRLRHQAALQAGQRATGEHRYELLPPEPGRGFGLLPRPSPGDVFFDMEGDPFWAADGGLEYLFGATSFDEGQPTYHSFWAHDRIAERKAFEDFMDFVAARRERYPDLHVYHYGHYEPTALKRLMGQHGTREDALDDLLRNEVLVDLFKVVRQGMRISYPSYSIKKVRKFFMAEAGDDAKSAIREDALACAGLALHGLVRNQKQRPAAWKLEVAAKARGSFATSRNTTSSIASRPSGCVIGSWSVATRRSSASTTSRGASRPSARRRRTRPPRSAARAKRSRSASCAEYRKTPTTGLMSRGSRGCLRSSSTTTGARPSPPGGHTSSAWRRVTTSSSTTARPSAG